MFLHYQQGLEAVQPTWKLFSEQLGIHIRPPTVRCLFFAKVVELLILDIPKPIELWPPRREDVPPARLLRQAARDGIPFDKADCMVFQCREVRAIFGRVHCKKLPCDNCDGLQ